MWTSKITSIAKGGGEVHIIVNFTNGEESVDKYYTVASKVDMEWLSRQIQVTIDNFNGAYAFADSISVDMPIAYKPPVVDPVVTPKI